MASVAQPSPREPVCTRVLIVRDMLDLEGSLRTMPESGALAYRRVIGHGTGFGEAPSTIALVTATSRLADGPALAVATA